ncbi:DNA methyltransferase [Streptomyces sp. IBSNAI001]|uniref:DNA methyltransferase n=1 Tax=Streptomyces sp. IBSNAI001 TaxID=3457499 RepID=UPI003FD2B618
MEQFDRRPDSSAEQDMLPVSFSPVGGDVRKLLSPKRPAVETAGMADAFPYYAGFSFDWASSRLRSIEDPQATVLDPWNGSGTTTLAAQAVSLRSIGIDLNPVASTVAKLRSHVDRQARVVPPPPRRARRNTSPDPLDAWFTKKTVARIRDWTDELNSTTPEVAAIGVVALFRIIRRVTKSFEGSNPTWVKRSKSEDELVHIEAVEFDDSMQNEQAFLADRLTSLSHITTPTSIVTASATRMPLREASIDVTLTSPPYLTRIDYAVAYARELAILGIDIATDRTLRSQLMGTTLIRRDLDTTSHRFGSIAQGLLRDVAEHKSKASGGYYLKQTVQYLSDLTLGLSEITRVSKPNAQLHLVVQDSYYKDVPVPLAKICIEEAETRGWTLSESLPYPVKRTLTTLNTSARAYKKGEVAESVISFKRG